MIFYLDTSVVVSALTNEPASRRVKAWLDAQAPAELAISDWVVTEFSSALSIKLRNGKIDVLRRAAAFAAFASLTAESFIVLSVAPQQFRLAARFADQQLLGLRGGDALHLAICAHHGAALCTLDVRLAEAGPAVGVNTIRP